MNIPTVKIYIYTYTCIYTISWIYTYVLCVYIYIYTSVHTTSYSILPTVYRLKPSSCSPFPGKQLSPAGAPDTTAKRPIGSSGVPNPAHPTPPQKLLFLGKFINERFDRPTRWKQSYDECPPSFTESGLTNKTSFVDIRST